MKSTMLAGTALAVALAGCVVYEEERVRMHGPPHGDVVVEEHEYVFFPAYDAYYCSVHDDWWVRDSGSWARVTIRPPRISLSAEIAWVSVDVRGPEPFIRYEEHVHLYPRDWKPSHPKGPPPGRGWKKHDKHD